MRAMVYERYGPPNVLRLEDVDTPVPEEDQVLVRVRASSINSWDWDVLTGTFQGRLGFMGWRKPTLPMLGADVAGTVERVGRDVTEFRVGDEVFGDISRHGFGGFAEYVAVPATALAIKSPTMTYQQAAATPQAGLLALQALREAGQIGPDDRVLINGAGGGVGTFAVQLAKAVGAEVTGVDHTAKLETVRSIGADHVIDYTQIDFTGNGQRYDLILDVVASRSIVAYARTLNPSGVGVVVGGSMGAILGAAALGRVMGDDRRMRVLVHRPDRDDLARLGEYYEAGEVQPVIDSVYPLAAVPEAFRRFGRGEAIGKIVITP